MKSWQIHFGWAILTVLAVCITARVSSERPEPVVAKPVAATSRPDLASPSSPEFAATLLPEAAAVEPAKPVATLPPGTAVERVRKLFLEERNYWQEAINALDAIQDRAEKLALLKEMLTQGKGNSRYMALNYFQNQKMKGRDVSEILEGALLMNVGNDNYLRPQIADLLGNLGDPGSVPALYESLRDAGEELKLSAAAALFKLGQTAPAGELMPTLVRMYESPDGALRKKAIESISKLHPEGAVPLLARALRDTNGDVRLEALYAISSLDKPELLSLVEPLVNDPVPEVAREAKDYVESLKEDKK